MTSSTDPLLNKPGQEAPFPTAAQIKQQENERRIANVRLAQSMNLRVRSIELAAQFKISPADDPMKLAREIYKFLSDTEV